MENLKTFLREVQEKNSDKPTNVQRIFRRTCTSIVQQVAVRKMERNKKTANIIFFIQNRYCVRKLYQKLSQNKF